MKHLLIIIFFLLLSSPVIGQSSKYESVSQCVLQTMEDRKLTGNDMFKMVKEECERSLGKVTIDKKTKGILFRDSPLSKFLSGGKKWYKTGDEKTQGKYEGDILNGIPNGHGTITTPDGLKYVGEFKDGRRHGYGTSTSPEGSSYVGDWKNGKQNGYGTLTTSDAGKYEGGYKDAMPHGYGIYITPDGEKYAGWYKNGLAHGPGTYTYSDGRKFVGEYKNHKKWNGTGYDKNGNIQVKFVNGEKIKQ